MANESRPAVRFLNFGSRFSFHFFEWVTAEGNCDLAALVASAKEEAKAELADASPEEQQCHDEVIREKVAEKLENFACQMASELTAGGVYCAEEVCDSAEPHVNLFAPAIQDAIRDVDYKTVAKAVLLKLPAPAPKTWEEACQRMADELNTAAAATA